MIQQPILENDDKATVFPIRQPDVRKAFQEDGFLYSEGQLPKRVLDNLNFEILTNKFYPGKPANWMASGTGYLDNRELMAVGCSWEVCGLCQQLVGERVSLSMSDCLLGREQDTGNVSYGNTDKFKIIVVANVLKETTEVRLKHYFDNGNDEVIELAYGDVAAIKPELVFKPGANLILYYNGLYERADLPTAELFAITQGSYFPAKKAKVAA